LVALVRNPTWRRRRSDGPGSPKEGGREGALLLRGPSSLCYTSGLKWAPALVPPGGRSLSFFQKSVQLPA
jgi:hypothetical protein